MSDVPSLDEIEQELLDLVDAGVLQMGWSSARQEFIFWAAEDGEAAA